jgi:NitT/TauT family transport system ATP-binding protein
VSTPALEVRHLEKVFSRGDQVVHALQDVSLTVEDGEFLTILGPSGCGKSTLLHIVGGFETATSGEVRVHGRPVTKPGRDRGMVFQQATLFPWKVVLDNVAWSYQVAKVNKKDARERARDLLRLVGLARFAGAYPAELSGGMRQRAALARTLALEPELLLMDEPFGALDAQTREVMQEELNRIWQEAGITVVFITHDIYEAIFLGDRVAVMSARPGRIADCVDIEIDRPRSGEVKKSKELLEYHNRFWDLLRHSGAGGEGH